MNAAELSPRRRRRRFLVGFEEGDLPVKREPDEDIKDYAETTMNELLGWYGYEKVDSRDTQGLNLTHFASNNSSATGNTNNPSSNGVSPPSSAIEGAMVRKMLPPTMRDWMIPPGYDLTALVLGKMFALFVLHHGIVKPIQLLLQRNHGNTAIQSKSVHSIEIMETSFLINW
ncbi:hypothetical protein TNCT_377851 [Trichonephila clavata]|uniref:Uncharacterized protein n=1 Tax=Trichonephila clavata TaxID=2740835 RepID=A0A8X6GWC6_TRICU|nr:hypothetical protein TNCT_377851 [Trichonephila clavata]